MKKISCFLLTVLLSSSLSAWDLSKDADGVKVYTRSVEGSPLKEFKAEVFIQDATLDQMESIMKDASNYPEWFADCSMAKILKRISESEWYSYYVTDVPWPFKDRDMATLFQMDKQPQSIVMKLEGQPEFIDEVDGYVRIPQIEGDWTFDKEPSGIMVTYQVHADPGGGIPKWLANSMVTDGPFNTLKNLRNRISRQDH